MKYFKLTDLLGQGILVLASLVLLLGKGLAEEVFFLFYFVLGGWQFLSFLVHLFLDTESWYHRKHRLFYGKTIAWTIAAAAGSFLLSLSGTPLFIFYLYVVLFITPLYAIAYGIISYREWQTILRKELIHLKN